MFCSNCGSELAPGAKFCSECGTKVETVAATEAIVEEPLKAESAFADRVSFDWSNVIDEPQKKEVPQGIKSQWAATTGSISERELYSEMTQSDDKNRTMDFIDILKADKEERERAALDKSIEYTEVLELDPELTGGTKPPKLHYAPLYDDVDAPVKTPFDEVSEPAKQQVETEELKSTASFEASAPEVQEVRKEASKFEIPDFLKKAVGFGVPKEEEPEVIPKAVVEEPVFDTPVEPEEAASVVETAEAPVAAEPAFEAVKEEAPQEPAVEEVKEEVKESEDIYLDEELYLDIDETSSRTERMSRVDAHTLAGIYDEEDLEDADAAIAVESAEIKEEVKDAPVDEKELFTEMSETPAGHTGMTIAAPADEEEEIEALKRRLAELTGAVDMRSELSAEPQVKTEPEAAPNIEDEYLAAAVPEKAETRIRDFTFSPEVTSVDDELFDKLIPASETVPETPVVEVAAEGKHAAPEQPNFRDFTFSPEVTAADNEFFEKLTPASETVAATPAVETPVVETPAVEAAAVEVPKAEEPVFTAPVIELPKEEPAVTAPVIELPKEEPVFTAPIAEEVKAETPAVEEFKLETPVVEEHTFEASKTPSLEDFAVEAPKTVAPEAPAVEAKSFGLTDTDEQIVSAPSFEAAQATNLEFESPAPAISDAQKEAFDSLVFDMPKEEAPSDDSPIAGFAPAITEAAATETPVAEEYTFEAPKTPSLDDFAVKATAPAEPAVQPTSPVPVIKETPVSMGLEPQAKVSDAVSLEDLEKDLFGEIPDDSEPETTKKIDKFYTLYRKNEEFQRLLDEEYSRLKGEHIQIPKEDVVGESAASASSVAMSLDDFATESAPAIKEAAPEVVKEAAPAPVKTEAEATAAVLEELAEDSRPVEDATIYKVDMPEELADTAPKTEENTGFSVGTEANPEDLKFGLDGSETAAAAAAAAAAGAAVAAGASNDKAARKAAKKAEKEAKKAAKKAQKEAAADAQVEYENVDGGSTILTILAVLVAILLVLLLVVILILHVAPDSGIALKIDQIIESITSSFSSIQTMSGINRLL